MRFQLAPRPVDEIKAEIGELLAQRKATQPTTKRTFGSVFKNPPGERGRGRLIEACGLKGHRIGGAVISERHANFIENAGGATSADALALMAEARRRVHERGRHRARARGALPRAARAAAAVGNGGRREPGRRGPVRGSDRADRLCPRRRVAAPSLAARRLLPTPGRSLVGLALLVAAPRPLCGRRQTSMFASPT